MTFVSGLSSTKDIVSKLFDAQNVPIGNRKLFTHAALLLESSNLTTPSDA